MKWYESLILAVSFSVVFAGVLTWLAPERIYDVAVVLEILVAVLVLHTALQGGKKIWRKIVKKMGT